jgi:uncharacterized damage-inducible protein DinB
MLAEAASYLERIEAMRQQIAQMIASTPAEALHWRPIADSDDHATNSLAVLATHTAGAEHFWIHEVVGQYPPTRDRDAEFAVNEGEPADLLQLLHDTGIETKKVLENLTEATLNASREVRQHTFPVRWCILHVLDHAALHLGHMELTFQLWQNRPA